MVEGWGSCPLPAQPRQITMAHGGGGRSMQRLLTELVGPALGFPQLDMQHDGASFELAGARLALTTDSYVVRPLEFPGGDIGSLAVTGTVNDLAMCGARPKFLSLGLILEEGLDFALLQRVLGSVRSAALQAGVEVVTGDTKVVDRGNGDGIFINTAGIGLREHDLRLGPAAVQPGDAILLSGDLGRHGIAIMAVREGLEFENPVASDAAPLHEPVLALLAAGLTPHCLRDATRGGLASALVEIAGAAGHELAIDERHIAVCPEVRGACELLGLDVLHVANEGRFVVILPEEQATAALACLGDFEVSRQARRIGSVRAGRGRVFLRTTVGVERPVQMLTGAALPRIC